MDSMKKQPDLGTDEDNSLLQVAYKVRKCGWIGTIPLKHQAEFLNRIRSPIKFKNEKKSVSFLQWFS